MLSLKLLAGPAVALGLAGLASTAQAAPVAPLPIGTALAVNDSGVANVEKAHYRRHWHRRHYYRPGFSFYVGPRWGWGHRRWHHW